jgi:hypothetical protein
MISVLDFVGAQLIIPYNDHDQTIKDIKVLAENNSVRFVSREDCIYHFAKHRIENKERRRHNKSIFDLSDTELLKEIRSYYEVISQQIIFFTKF